MPANLSPEYKAAEAAFRATRDPRTRLDGLREMLRTIPKHKGTEHLQADIKARIKDLGDQLEGGGHKAGGHGGPSLVIRPEGAAQVALLGPPNAGKSELHLRLTGSHAQVAPYPFTTQFPQAGMLPFEDIQRLHGARARGVDPHPGGDRGRTACAGARRGALPLRRGPGAEDDSLALRARSSHRGVKLPRDLSSSSAR